MRDEKRPSFIGYRYYLPKEDKPSEVVREVVKAHDDFIAKLLGFVLAVVVPVVFFTAVYYLSKFAH